MSKWSKLQGSERRMDQLENEYLSLRIAVRAAAAQASELPNIQASLNDVRRKLEVLQQGGHAQILSAYRTRRQTNDTWNAILEATGRGLNSAGSAVDDLSVAELELGVENEDDAPRAAIRRAHESLNRLIAEFRQSVAGRITEVERQLAAIRAGPDANEWNAAVQESEAEFENTVARLAEEGISDPTEYGSLVDQATTLEAEIARLTGERQSVVTLETQVQEVLARYREERGQLNARRREFAKSASGDALRVDVNAYAGHSNLANDLEGILGIQRFLEDRRAIAGRIRPQDTGEWDWNRLDAVVAEMRRFHMGLDDSWDTQDARFKPALRGIPPERIDRLALYLPEDTVSVRFRDAGSSNDWRSLSQGSPGQQTAALLAFVLGFGDEPIILDQPEDDLDSTLIYELLVKRFRETKSTRQMIVVTHNPNIVVHGDAEYVVSLDVRNGQTTVRCSGGLQEIIVRDEICRVMEGGREAFQSRYHRIIPQLRSGIMMPQEDLARRIRLGEDSTLELKRVLLSGSRVTGPERRDFADELGSIANGSGGTVLLGVDDATRDVLGIPIDRLDVVETWVREICNDSLHPPLDATIRKIELPDATGNLVAVIRIDVPRSLFVHRSPGGYFRNIGSSKRQMSPEMLARLFQERSQSRVIRFDESIVPGTSVDDLDEELTHRFMRQDSALEEGDLRKLRVVATGRKRIPAFDSRRCLNVHPFAKQLVAARADSSGQLRWGTERHQLPD